MSEKALKKTGNSLNTYKQCLEQLEENVEDF